MIFQEQPYLFVPAPQMRAKLEAVGSLSDFEALAATWDALEVDTFMADGGRYRRRRHAVFECEAGGSLARAPHQPHFQATDYNPLNGGVARWFAPLEERAEATASLQTILRLGRALFEPLRPAVIQWKVELHQFRIEAQPGMAGQPTPEGIHRDGVSCVLVLLVRRENIQSGTTTIHDLRHRTIGEFTLTHPLDTALVDDARAFHGVTAVQPLDLTRPAYRDVLVLTWNPRDAP